MKLVHYYIINKTTKETYNTGCRLAKAQEILTTKPDPENWEIVRKHKSI